MTFKLQSGLRAIVGAIVFAWASLVFAVGVLAQSDPNSTLTFATVDRPPFSMEINGVRTGFSIDLIREIAKELNADVQFEPMDSFAQMFDAVQQGRVDGAVANISITSERETVMDFSQPIFESGLQILAAADSGGSPSLFKAVFTMDIAFTILVAFAILFLGGMVMWSFERRSQPYFDRPMKDALFPSFWWALNLIVNGGFEERIPRSRPGRVLAVIMVAASLFIVSAFVAQITSAMTVQAISGPIDSINDLEDRRVGTTSGSTAASFLDVRDIKYAGFTTFETLMDAYENEELEAVVFDGPILAYHLRKHGDGTDRLVERVFKREFYGIALSQGSDLTEALNLAVLTVQEDGRYNQIFENWFGPEH